MTTYRATAKVTWSDGTSEDLPFQDLLEGCVRDLRGCGDKYWRGAVLAALCAVRFRRQGVDVPGCADKSTVEHFVPCHRHHMTPPALRRGQCLMDMPAHGCPAPPFGVVCGHRKVFRRHVTAWSAHILADGREVWTSGDLPNPSDMSYADQDRVLRAAAQDLWGRLGLLDRRAARVAAAQDGGGFGAEVLRRAGAFATTTPSGLARLL